MSTIDRIVGERLRERREKMGWSAAEFSERLEIEVSELVAIEAGAQRLGATLMMNVCRILDVRPQYFFTHIEPEEIDMRADKKDNSDGCCWVIPFRRH